jgi:hypothetical protein
VSIREIGKHGRLESTTWSRAIPQSFESHAKWRVLHP